MYFARFNKPIPLSSNSFYISAFPLRSIRSKILPVAQSAAYMDKRSFLQLIEILDLSSFSIRSSMSEGSILVAKCYMKQAECLARDVVFNYIGDDLNLYPVSAERKLNRAKARGLRECDIPKDEMTIKDTIFVVYAFANGEDFSKRTMRDAFS